MHDFLLILLPLQQTQESNRPYMNLAFGSRMIIAQTIHNVGNDDQLNYNYLRTYCPGCTYYIMQVVRICHHLLHCGVVTENDEIGRY
jgi:hypothetical protein